MILPEDTNTKSLSPTKENSSSISPVLEVCIRRFSFLIPAGYLKDIYSACLIQSGLAPHKARRRLHIFEKKIGPAYSQIYPFIRDIGEGICESLFVRRISASTGKKMLPLIRKLHDQGLQGNDIYLLLPIIQDVDRRRYVGFQEHFFQGDKDGHTHPEYNVRETNDTSGRQNNFCKDRLTAYYNALFHEKYPKGVFVRRQGEIIGFIKMIGEKSFLSFGAGKDTKGVLRLPPGSISQITLCEELWKVWSANGYLYPDHCRDSDRDTRTRIQIVDIDTIELVKTCRAPQVDQITDRVTHGIKKFCEHTIREAEKSGEIQEYEYVDGRLLKKTSDVSFYEKKGTHSL